MADRDHIHLHITSTVNSWITHASTTNRWCLWVGSVDRLHQSLPSVLRRMSSQPLFFFNKLLLQLLLPHSLNVWIKMRYRTRTLLGLCQDRITLYFQDFALWIRLIHHFDQSHCWITANARHPKWGACGLHDFLRSRHVPISGREPSVKQHVPKTSKKRKHMAAHISSISSHLVTSLSHIHPQSVQAVQMEWHIFW